MKFPLGGWGESLHSQLMSDQLPGLLPFYQKLTLTFSGNGLNLKANRNIKASFLAESKVLWFLRVKPGGASGRSGGGSTGSGWLFIDPRSSADLHHGQVTRLECETTPDVSTTHQHQRDKVIHFLLAVLAPLGPRPSRKTQRKKKRSRNEQRNSSRLKKKNPEPFTRSCYSEESELNFRSKS